MTATMPHEDELHNDDELVELNRQIGVAECRADRAWFETLLHERFTMRRPGGRLDNRDGLLAGLRAGDSRTTDEVEVVLWSPCRSVVTCVVTKWPGDGPEPAGAARFHNLRVFLRDDEDDPWQLLCWLNEPA